MAVAGPSHYIDLTLDDESFSTTMKYSHKPILNQGNIIELFSDDEHEGPTMSNSKSTRNQGFYWSDDEVIVVASTIDTTGKSSKAALPRASASKLDASPCDTNISEDDAVARRLAQEHDRPGSADLAADEELVRHLAEKEVPEHLIQDELLAHRLAKEYNEEFVELSVSPDDEELARQLAEQEEANFNNLLNTIDSKEEGIIFSVVVNAADDTLEDGSPAHPDDLERFRPWKQLFEQSGRKVTRFHWFVNYELEKRFEQARDKLEGIIRQPSQELQLFHGTSATNIDLILKGGFRIGGVAGHPVTNGAARGCGIYLAADAATSINYAMGANKIFACRVIPGRLTDTVMNTPPRSTHPGTERWECYQGGGIYVHRYTSLVLPCYMIEFDDPHHQQMNGFGVNGLGSMLPGLGGLGGMRGFGGGLGGMRGFGGMGAVAARPAPRTTVMQGLIQVPTRSIGRGREAVAPTSAAPSIHKRPRTRTTSEEPDIPARQKRQRKTQGQSKTNGGEDKATPSGRGKARRQ